MGLLVFTQFVYMSEAELGGILYLFFCITEIFTDSWMGTVVVFSD